MINKNKRMVTVIAISFFSVIFYGIIVANATIYPTYDNEADCRGCHGLTANRHHFLVANGTHQCTDCHAMKYDNQSQSYYPEVIRNCLTCHVEKNHTNVHHFLVQQGLFVCSDCHPMIYDNATQSYSPQVTWDCTTCHSTVLRLNETPPPSPTPAVPNPPTVSSFSPSSPVNDIIGATRKFNISIDQIVNLTWSINGNPVQYDNNVTDASYTNTSTVLGLWNVSVNASNVNGNVSFTWAWNVTLLPPSPSITSTFPGSSVNDSVGASRKFGITIDQIADITWYINDVPVQSDYNVMGSSYNNTSASIGIWNVKTVATNANGSVSYSWTWNVIDIPNPPKMINFSPSSPINDIEGASETFSVQTNQTTDMVWYVNDNPVQSDYNVIESSYTNNSAIVGTWNVKVNASNVNGSATNYWTWNVIQNPKPMTIIDPPNGTNGWYTTNTIYLNATDTDSIKYTNYSVDGGSWISNPGSGTILKTPVTLSDGIHSIQYYSVDNLNGIELTNTQTVKIDKTSPQITINSPVNGSIYTLNQNLIANWFVNDITSGIATATGTYPNGGTISTSSPGTKNFSVIAVDNAGNTNTKNVTYYVRYGFGNFLSPIKNDGSSIFKLGNTIPIKFQLKDANGNYITSAYATLTITKISSSITGRYYDSSTTLPASSGYVFVYTENGHMYMYNLATKGMSTGTWQIRVNIDDGSYYTVNFSLKKG